MKMKAVTDIGMVHGRFQPFHLGHLEYVSMALGLCSHLVIGITNPEPSELVEDEASPHRHLPDSNPFTYFQRAEMIRYSLIASKCDLGRISIVPFHLFSPEKWKYYLPNPLATTQFLRLFTNWERKKATLFKNYGFSVEILDVGATKLTEGSVIRQLMRNNEEWEHLIPSGTKEIINRALKGRL